MFRCAAFRFHIYKAHKTFSCSRDPGYTASPESSGHFQSLYVSQYNEARQNRSLRSRYWHDGATPHLLELTWLRDMDRPYELGDNEIHLAFEVDDFDAALAKHKEMGCVCFENPAMGIYFIEDPDGYWLEIVPAK